MPDQPHEHRMTLPPGTRVYIAPVGTDAPTLGQPMTPPWQLVGVIPSIPPTDVPVVDDDDGFREVVQPGAFGPVTLDVAVTDGIGGPRIGTARVEDRDGTVVAHLDIAPDDVPGV